MAGKEYLFIFGRTPKLALTELQTIIHGASLITPEVAWAQIGKPQNINHLMDTLGGTVKIADVTGRVDSLTPEALVPYLTSSTGSLEFGVSFYGSGQLPRTLAFEIKKELEHRGIRARYVTPAHGDSLSTVAVDKGHLSELVIVKGTDDYIVGLTRATQPYEMWNMRDYGRPYSDAKSGMLPPKVARMIVNIAGTPGTILDPFCGMGTIPAEGYMTGRKVFGSDSSAMAVEKAQKNLAWLVGKFPDTKGSIGQLFVSDAVHVSDHVPAHSIDAIVTEPFMGSTGIATNAIIDLTKVKNTLKGLEKLYIGCLRDWQKILVAKGKIIIALPAYALSGREYTVKKVVDMCEILGYTIVDGPIEYSRPQAVVKRQFYIFQKK